jgi:colanic acid biosynthesis glycosyl transferase WcaI
MASNIKMSGSDARLWVFSEVFYPEETGTGYYISIIAEHLAMTRKVSALCVQPSYSKHGVRAPEHEVHNGVEIFRCRSIIPAKKSLPARLVKIGSISLSLLCNAFYRLRRGDVILVVTNPPTLPTIAALLSLVYRTRYVLLINDMYPEMLSACSLMSEFSLAYRMLKRISRFVLRRAYRIITIGRDMQQRAVSAREMGGPQHILVIPQWSDCGQIFPSPREQNKLLNELDLTNKFVVQYAGNMGHPHDIETLVQVIKALRTAPEIHFLILGSGIKRKLLEALAAEGGCNLTLLQERPRADQQTFLNACDISIMTLKPRVLGLGVPSRTYNLMAAGKPVIALVPEDSETAKVVLEEAIGWVVTPGDAKRTVEVILSATQNREQLREMGARARAAAEAKYSPEMILKQFDSLLADFH